MTYEDIQNRTYDLSDTTIDDFSDARMTRALKAAAAKVSSKILILNGWEVDDANYADLPVAKAALVANQQDYSLGVAYLVIRRVEIKDSSGAWHLLAQIDRQQKKGDDAVALAVGESTRTGAYQATAGIPAEYDLAGYSLLLYPAPSYSQAGSLLVYYSRAQLDFSYVTDTFTDSTGSLSSTPGFNALSHDLLPLTMAFEYCNLYKPEKVRGLQFLLDQENKKLEEFYGLRNQDLRGRMIPGRHNMR